MDQVTNHIKIYMPPPPLPHSLLSLLSLLPLSPFSPLISLFSIPASFTGGWEE